MLDLVQCRTEGPFSVSALFGPIWHPYQNNMEAPLGRRRQTISVALIAKLILLPPFFKATTTKQPLVCVAPTVVFEKWAWLCVTGHTWRGPGGHRESLLLSPLTAAVKQKGRDGILEEAFGGPSNS